MSEGLGWFGLMIDFMWNCKQSRQTFFHVDCSRLMKAHAWLWRTCGSKVNLTHIRHFRRIQAHWQAYDAYARVCVAMGTNQLLGWVLTMVERWEYVRQTAMGHAQSFAMSFFSGFGWLVLIGPAAFWVCSLCGWLRLLHTLSCLDDNKNERRLLSKTSNSTCHSGQIGNLLPLGYMMLGTLVAENDVPFAACSCVVIFTTCAWVLARPDSHGAWAPVNCSKLI